MKVLLCHLAVIVYYVEFNIRAVTFSKRILVDIKPYSENMFTFLVQLCTLWNLVLQQLYLLVVTVDDIYRLTSKSTDVQRSSFTHQRITSVFTRYVLPCSIVTSANFWTVVLLDPRSLDEHDLLTTHISKWENHGMHTMTVVFVFLEVFAAHRLYTRDIMTEMKAAVTLTLVYFSVVAVTIPFSTIWTYPFFGMFKWYHWLMYVVVNLLLTCFATATAYVLGTAVWGKRRVEILHHSVVERKTS